MDRPADIQLREASDVHIVNLAFDCIEPDLIDMFITKEWDVTLPFYGWLIQIYGPEFRMNSDKWMKKLALPTSWHLSSPQPIMNVPVSPAPFSIDSLFSFVFLCCFTFLLIFIFILFSELIP